MVHLRYLTMRWKARLSYRADFVSGVFADLLVVGIGLAFIGALFTHAPTIRGWSLHEVVLVWGMAEVAGGVFAAAFAGLWQLNPRYLLGGELDRVLLRPLDPFLQVLMDHVRPAGLTGAILGIAMIGWAAGQVPGPLGPRWLLLPIFVAGGVLVLAGILVTVSAVGFRLHHRGTAIGLVHQAAVFGRYPIDLYSRPLQRVLTTVLPLGFIAFFPASYLVGRDAWSGLALAQPVVGLGLFLGAQLVWRRAARGYRSTGS